MQNLNERDLAITHGMLDPETFEEAWTEGRAMSLEEAVAYAISEADTPEERPLH